MAPARRLQTRRRAPEGSSAGQTGDETGGAPRDGHSPARAGWAPVSASAPAMSNGRAAGGGQKHKSPDMRGFRYVRRQFDSAFASSRSLPIPVRWRRFSFPTLPRCVLPPRYAVWNRSAVQHTVVWLLVPSAITMCGVEAHGLPLPLRPLDATSWSLRYSASHRRRERLTPQSANHSWSFAPLDRVCSRWLGGVASVAVHACACPVATALTCVFAGSGARSRCTGCPAVAASAFLNSSRYRPSCPSALALA